MNLSSRANLKGARKIQASPGTPIALNRWVSQVSFFGRQDLYLRPLVFLMSASHFSPAWTLNRHGKVASLRCGFEYINRKKVQPYCEEQS
jgi:hypothetical protein